ncbi:MAG: TRAP transporter large permease subunit, partial [Gammaproteobacteria bacterium]
MGSLGSTGLIVLTLFGTPLFVIIVAAAFLGFYVSDIPSTVIAIEMYRLVETPMLMALPLFTFAGYVLAESRMSQRLVTLTDALMGSLPGGLALIAYV